MPDYCVKGILNPILKDSWQHRGLQIITLSFLSFFH